MKHSLIGHVLFKDLSHIQTHQTLHTLGMFNWVNLYSVAQFLSVVIHMP